MDSLVTVKVFPSRIEAEIAKSKLNAHNIQSIISADDAGGAYPFPLSPTNQGVKLRVHAKYLGKAKELLP